MCSRFLTLIIILLAPVYSFAQEGDSEFGKYKENKNLCLRSELGWHKSWFASLGASYVYSNVNSHTPLHFVVYASAEADLRTYGPRTPFYAYKAGFEMGNLFFACGAEIRNNTDFTGKNHLILTPKIGLSAFGHFNLFYGYNIFRTANNIFGINHSQISLSLNLNRKVFIESFVPAK